MRAHWASRWARLPVAAIGCRVPGPGETPAAHIATTASRSDSDSAPCALVIGVGSFEASGASASDWTSLAYSFFERPESISSDATTTSVREWRLGQWQARPRDSPARGQSLKVTSNGTRFRWAARA